jgi:hypothetical protein
VINDETTSQVQTIGTYRVPVVDEIKSCKSCILCCVIPTVPVANGSNSQNDTFMSLQARLIKYSIIQLDDCWREMKFNSNSYSFCWLQQLTE